MASPVCYTTGRGLPVAILPSSIEDASTLFWLMCITSFYVLTTNSTIFFISFPRLYTPQDEELGTEQNKLLCTSATKLCRHSSLILVSAALATKVRQGKSRNLSCRWTYKKRFGLAGMSLSGNDNRPASGCYLRTYLVLTWPSPSPAIKPS